MLRRRPALAGGALLATALVVTGCGSSHHAAVRSTTTASTVPTTVAPTTVPATDPATLAPVTTTVPRPAPTSTLPKPTTPTTAPSAFAPVVNAAMKTFTPAAGLEAPVTLPAAPQAISAQATNLGGSDSVTLVATPTALPVNDPSLSASPGSDLGTFSSTPTSAPSTATAYVTNAQTNTLAACSGASTPVTVGAMTGTSCSSVQGSLIDLTDGAWTVQILAMGATAAPTDTATAVAGWISAHKLPPAAVGTFDVIVATAGAPTSSLTWADGAAVYQTRSQQSVTAAADLADAMRPWSA